MEHVCDGAARSNSVDSDLLVTAVLAKNADQGINGSFAARVQGVFRNGEVLGSVLGGKDDTTASFQVLVRFTSNKKLASSVQAEHAVEFFFGDILSIFDQHRAH